MPFADGFATLQWVTGLDFPAAVAAVADVLNMQPNGRRPAATTAKPTTAAVPTTTTDGADEAAKRRERLVKTWQATVKDNGRIADYKRSRGLSGTVPAALRLHPALGYFDEDRKRVGTYPAILARVTDAAGLSVSLHTTSRRRRSRQSRRAVTEEAEHAGSGRSHDRRCR